MLPVTQQLVHHNKEERQPNKKSETSRRGSKLRPGFTSSLTTQLCCQLIGPHLATECARQYWNLPYLFKLFGFHQPGCLPSLKPIVSQPLSQLIFIAAVPQNELGKLITGTKKSHARQGMQLHNQHRNCVPYHNQVHGMLEWVVHGNLALSQGWTYKFPIHCQQLPM